MMIYVEQLDEVYKLKSIRGNKIILTNGTGTITLTYKRRVTCIKDMKGIEVLD